MAIQRNWHFDSNIVEIPLEELLKLNCEAWEIFDIDYNWLLKHVDNTLAFEDDEDAPVSGLVINKEDNKILLYASDAEYIVQDIIDYYRNQKSHTTTEISNLNVGFL
jgi:hypothetical protein